MRHVLEMAHGLRLATCFVLAMGTCCVSSGSPEIPCPGGTRNCPCLEGDLPCVDPSLSCDASGTCVDVPCDAGWEGCRCLPDALCVDDLVCLDETCQVRTGGAGEGCLEGGRCATGGKCVDNQCVPCEPGSKGCACYVDGTCDGFACVGGICVNAPSEELEMPVDLTCYTPCEASFYRSDGTWVACSADGLMEGCLGKKVCKEGSCVGVGEERIACVGDLSCPDFQSCIEGRCVSSCTEDAQCPLNLRCHRRVCRIACEATNNACPKGQTCNTVDGTSGFCMPLVVPETTVVSTVSGTYRLSTQTVKFTNLTTQATVTVTNASPSPLEFLVRRKSERRVSANGNISLDETQPLPWLRIAVPGECGAQSSSDTGFRLLVPGDGGTAKFEVCEAHQGPQRWQGTLEITNASLGRKLIDVQYSELPNGAWSGSMVTFGAFDSQDVPAWVAFRRGLGPDPHVPNALLQRYEDFAEGRIAWVEFLAVLKATETEAWRFPSVQARCAQKAPGAACYLYDNLDGLAVYSSTRVAYPIPTGPLRLPLTLNLKVAAGGRSTSCSDPLILKGQIDSERSLHYPGLPQAELTLASSVNGACGTTSFGDHIVAVTDFVATAYVGGRYLAREPACLAGEGTFAPRETPWLVPGFLGQAVEGDTPGSWVSRECRSRVLPFGDLSDDEPLNLALSAANPVPDGQAKKRHLSLLDGVMVNQDTLFLLLEETFTGFGPGEKAFAAYGYALLSRTPADPEGLEYAGRTVDEARVVQPDISAGAICAPELVEEVLGRPGPPTPNPVELETLVHALVGAPQDGPTTHLDASEEHVHYLCVQTSGHSFFGPRVGENARTCPAGSTVVYFALSTTVAEAMVTGNACQARGSSDDTCADVLDRWREQGFGNVRLDPLWTCSDRARGACDSDRTDLRADKVFYAAATDPALLPIGQQLDNAFRYRTRFRNRQGLNIGFTPEICVQSGSQQPYCYDPSQIEALAARFNCAFAVYGDSVLFDALSESAQQLLRGALERAVSRERTTDVGNGAIEVVEGFEFLYAQLLTLLGDDAYARAFASRLDSSGDSGRSFDGPAFESGGIVLAGAAGAEMHQLYLATQYYQRVLDRFYRLEPWLTVGERTVLTPASAATYLTRLSRASAQKARAFSVIAQGYQNLRRSDLAQRVLERAYTGAYLESVLLGRRLQLLAEGALPSERAQLDDVVRSTQRVYTSALSDMRAVYENLRSNINVFGFSDDYVPFPALDPGDSNAFEKLRRTSRDKLDAAIVAETRAVEETRSYEVEAQAFANELVTLRNTYENQLREICGVVEDAGGVKYPAIPRYAYFDPMAEAIIDPCGFTGTGSLFANRVKVSLAGTELESVRQQFETVRSDIEIERDRVSQQCNLTLDLRDFRIDTGNEKIRLSDTITDLANDIDSLRTGQSNADRVAQAASACTPAFGAGSYNPVACAALSLNAGVGAFTGKAVDDKQKEIRDAEGKMRRLEMAQMGWETAQGCDVAKVDSEAKVRSLTLRFGELELEALKADYGIRLALSEQQKLRDDVDRLLMQWAEAEEMAQNLQSARTDPNVRIYKNDAIIEADRTFEAARRHVYRMTKVFEYFTSQSYGDFDKLYQVRMVSRGQPNLSAYVDALNAEYEAFLANFGRPSLRLAILSLRDDILKIPRLGDNGDALAHNARVRLFRDRLQSNRLIDARGYLSIPFSTRDALVSPLTRNHKVHSIEAEIESVGTGDGTALVYVEQRGTGVVQSVDDDKLFFAFPERTAVLNAYFNGDKRFSPDLYRNERLRERPFLNTHWELVFNQRDESANEDVALGDISDIRLYIYYTDLTAL